MEAEEEPFDRIYTDFRVVLKWYAVKIRHVIDKITNPSNLLELAALAVTGYELPTDELPEKLEILLHEGSIQTQYVKLIEEIELLKCDVPMVLAKLSATVIIVLGVDHLI